MGRHGNKKAFIDSRARCATRQVDDIEADEIEAKLKGNRSGNGGGGKGEEAAKLPAQGLVTIPVYVHVINKGSGIANGDVTNQMINDQIGVLNDAYSGGNGGAPLSFSFSCLERLIRQMPLGIPQNLAPRLRNR